MSAVGARCGKCFRAPGKWTAIANTSPKRQKIKRISFLACKAASTQILFYVKEATHGTRRIETDLLKDWKVYVPPKESVKAIVEKARKNMAIVDALEKKFVGALKYTDKLEQSILAKAFRGELIK